MRGAHDTAIKERSDRGFDEVSPNPPIKAGRKGVQSTVLRPVVIEDSRNNPTRAVFFAKLLGYYRPQNCDSRPVVIEDSKNNP